LKLKFHFYTCRVTLREVLDFILRPRRCCFVVIVIMRESIGRTDLPGGSYEVLKQSIQKKVYALPESVTLLSGHGPKTTVAWEKKYNPFVPYEN